MIKRICFLFTLNLQYILENYYKSNKLFINVENSFKNKKRI